MSVSTIKYTYLKSECGEELEEFLAIATSDHSLVILKDSKVVATIKEAHKDEITQIICLTDNYCSLTFVTLSLDHTIKLYDEAGNLKSQAFSDGKIISGCAIPD